MKGERGKMEGETEGKEEGEIKGNKNISVISGLLLNL